MLKLGLVFAGGGGKGAYEIGVWKALRETGFDRYVRAAAGTSVGGLNAALFVQGDYEIAEQIWENISPQQILSRKNRAQKAMEKGEGYRRSIFTRAGMRDIIDRNLNLGIFDESGLNCYLACYKVKEESKFMYLFNKLDSKKSDENLHNLFRKLLISEQIIEKKATYFNLRNYTFEERKRILLATSAIPLIFPDERVRNAHFVDGSVRDNVPILPLYCQEKCNMIIVVHLKRESDLICYDEYPNARILEIVPKENLGGIFRGVLDFDPSHAKERIEMGYRDAIGAFADLKDRQRREIAHMSTVGEEMKKERIYRDMIKRQDEEYERLCKNV